MKIYGKNGKEKAGIGKFQYSGTFMGESFLSFNLDSPAPIDFQIGDWCEYRGERFELNYTPAKMKRSSARSIGDAFQYKGMKFNSLADELTRCDFLDVVLNDNKIHFTSLPNFSFTGNARALADRIQANLNRIYTGEKAWTVTVDPSFVTDPLFVQADNMKCMAALQLVNSLFKGNYVIRGRHITIGTAGLSVGKIFGYGKGNGLYTIEEQTGNDALIITRLRAYGSTRNMPERYYNGLKGSDGQPLIPASQYVPNLMLPSFAENGGDAYIDSPNIGAFGVREATVFFDGSDQTLPDIYPSLEGMTAEELKTAGVTVDATGALDVIVSAEQIADNGVPPTEGEIQPTFTVDIKDIGFNINDVLTGETAQVSMRTGACSGRTFDIARCERVTGGYRLTLNRVEDESLHLYFPYNLYNVGSGDKFVLLQIKMPDVYIRAASQRLLTAARKYLGQNDKSRKTYIPKIDKVFMARNPQFHDTIKEGDIFNFNDTDLGIDASVIIQTLTIKEGGEVPEYDITLFNDKAESSVIQKMQNAISSIANTVGITLEQAKSLFRTMINAWYPGWFDQQLHVSDDVRFRSISSPRFVAGMSGEGFRIDPSGDAEFRNLTVRNTFSVFELLVQQIRAVGGQLLVSGGSEKIMTVEETADGYKCRFNTDGGTSANPFVVGDQLIHQVFTGHSVKRYWRLVTEVGADYFVLSKSDCEAGSGMPAADEEVILFGNRTDARRQNAVMISAHGGDAPSIKHYKGIDSYSTAGKMKLCEGNLEGIVDEAFGQLHGMGLYAENVYLHGRFAMSSGKAVEDALSETEQSARDYADKAVEDVKIGSSNFILGSDFRDDAHIIKYDEAAFGVSGDTLTVDFPEKYMTVSELAGASAGDTLYSLTFDAGRDIHAVLNYHYSAEDMGFGYYLLDIEKKKYVEENASVAGNVLTVDFPSGSVVIFETGRDFVKDKEYTVSFDARSDGNTVLDCNRLISTEWGDDIALGISFPLTGGWERFERVFKSPVSGRYYFGLGSGRRGSAQIRHIKLENGNKATAWSPATEDVQGQIDETVRRLSENITFVNSINKELQEAKKQIDGAISAWFFDPAPTLSNEPAVQWKTAGEKNAHLGDLYYDANGKAYRFELKEGVYRWSLITDADLTLALRNAKNAQDTADRKRQVFINQPTDASAYDSGDLWVNATYGSLYKDDLLRCRVSKPAGAPFDISHWELASKYTDDTKANEAAAAAATAKSAADAADTKAQKAVNDAKVANALLADMSNDNKLTAQEKQNAKKEWDIIVSEKPKNDAAADQYGVSKSAYDTAYSTLSSYLTPLLEDLTVTSDITGSVFRGKWKVYYDARTDLLNSISKEAKQLADAAQAKANEAASKANEAITAAATAKSAADSAKSTADNMKKRLDDWAKDSVISPTEKQGIKEEKARIEAEKKQINDAYAKYSLGVPTAYNNAYTAYSGQLGTLSAASPENIPIPSDFASNQTAYYNQRTACLNAIADATKKYAEDKVGDVKIGTVNLISKKMLLKWNEKDRNIAVWGMDNDGLFLNVNFHAQYAAWKTNISDCFGGRIKYKPDTQYVFSIRAKNINPLGDVYFGITIKDKGDLLLPPIPDDGKVHRVDCILPKGDTIDYIYITSMNHTPSMRIYDISLVEGNKPLQDFPVAEEDMRQDNVNLADGGKDERTVTANNTENNKGAWYDVSLIKPNTVYHTSFKARNLAGDPEKYTAGIYDETTNVWVSTLEPYHQGGILVTQNNFTPRKVSLVITAGVNGSTAGNSVAFSEVMLVEGFYPPPAWSPSYNDTKKQIDDAAAAGMNEAISSAQTTATSLAEKARKEAIAAAKGELDNAKTILYNKIDATEGELDNAKTILYNKIDATEARSYSIFGKTNYDDAHNIVSTKFTMVDQTAEQITSLAQKVDALGNTLESSGFITQSNFVTIFSQKKNELGQTIMSSINVTPRGVTINGDKINLNGAVVVGTGGNQTKIENGKLTAVNGIFRNAEVTGEITATSGRIGGFSIVGNGLSNTPYDNDAYVIFRNDEHNCFAGIGGNVLPATSGLRAVARLENEDTTDQWKLKRNIAALLSARNGRYNHAFLGSGNGNLDGWIGGYKYSKLDLVTANIIYGSYSNLKDNNRWVIYSGVDNAGITLPRLTEVRDALAIGTDTRFCVEFTVVADIGSKGFRIFGRNTQKSGDKYPWNTDEMPTIINWDNGYWDKINMVTGNSVAVWLIYDPDKGGTSGGFPLKYTARVVNRKN